MGQRFISGYDRNGNKITQTDANGKSATMTYDVNNRLTQETYQDGTSFTHTYTPTGQRKTVTDARGTTTYDYDVRDRLTRRVDPDGREIRYEYDLVGNRTAIIIPSGRSQFAFDPMNRVSTVTNGSDITSYGYDEVGNLVNTQLPNGVVESRAYDTLNRLTKVESKKGSDVLAGFAYTLDKAGMRTGVTEQDGRKVDYGYDQIYRLTSEKITDPINGNRTTTYALDPVGNRLSKTDASGTVNSTYDANDRLLSDGSSTYEYDYNGNTLSRTKNANDKVTYTWDDRNRLTGAVVTTPTGVKQLSNQYNSDGIRVSSTVDGQETRYLIDDNQQYAQVLEEYSPAPSTIPVSYVYGNDLISQNRNGLKSFYLMDGLGSTRALTNASGDVTDNYNYSAFGDLVKSTGSAVNNYLFAGEQFDKNLNQYYLRDRCYGTDIGGFTGMDSWEGDTRKPISLNKYIYTESNPVNAIDPSGKSSILESQVVQSILNSLVSTVIVRTVGGAGAVGLLIGLPFFLNNQFGSRRLTAIEKNTARSIFHNTINYDEVKVAPKPITASATSVLVWGNTIYADKNSEDFIGGDITFIHEMTHIWQYQNNGLWYAGDSIVEQIKSYISSGNRKGAYTSWEGSYSSLGFENISAEEQAMVVQEYYEAREKGNQDRVQKLQPAIDDYIRQNRGAR